jgi:hypothetical protein
VQRHAGHANVRTTQAYMHAVDRVVGDERLSAMKVMYDRVQAAGQPLVTPRTAASAGQHEAPPAGAASPHHVVLEQLTAMVLSNSGLTAAEKAALLLELASQAASTAGGAAAPATLHVVDEQSG